MSDNLDSSEILYDLESIVCETIIITGPVNNDISHVLGLYTLGLKGHRNYITWYFCDKYNSQKIAVTSTRTIEELYKAAQKCRIALIKKILTAIRNNPGCRNCDIADWCKLRMSDQNGQNKDFLTWNLLQELESRNIICRDGKRYWLVDDNFDLDSCNKLQLPPLKPGKKSLLAQGVFAMLLKLIPGAKLTYEMKYNGCKHIKKLPFDVLVTWGPFSLLVEIDGQQHFTPIKRFGGPEKFLMNKIRDRIKDDYTLKYGKNFLRIGYNATIHEQEKAILKIKDTIEGRKRARIFCGKCYKRTIKSPHKPLYKMTRNELLSSLGEYGFTRDDVPVVYGKRKPINKDLRMVLRALS